MHQGCLKDFQDGSRVPVGPEASTSDGPASPAGVNAGSGRAPFGLAVGITVLIGCVLGAVSTLPVMTSQIAALIQGRPVQDAGFLGFALTTRAEIPKWVTWVLEIGICGGLAAAVPGALILEALSWWDNRPVRRRVRAACAGLGVGVFFGVLCWLACGVDRAGAATPDSIWFPLTVVAGGTAAGYLSAAWHELVWKSIRRGREIAARRTSI